MKQAIRFSLVCLAGLLLFSNWGIAGTLKEDYLRIEDKRRELEEKRKEYEANLRTLASRRQKHNLVLYQCIQKNWRPEWEDKLKAAKKSNDLLETERLELVKLRIELDKVRSGLENSRADIETKYRKKAKGKEYEAEFREYMGKLDSEYFSRIEKELFKGYQHYMSGFETYLRFLEHSIEECNNPPEPELTDNPEDVEKMGSPDSATENQTPGGI